MKRKKTTWPKDDFGFPEVEVVDPGDDSERYSVVCAEKCPDGSLWNAVKRFTELLEHAVLLIGIVELLLLPPILAIPAIHALAWMVEALESLERALKSIWADVLSYISWLLTQTGKEDPQVH